MIGLSTHPWMSGLFGDDEIATIFAPEAELQRYLRIEAAWTRALGTASGNADAEDVALSLETAVIDPAALKDGFAKDGIPIPALVKILKARHNADAADLIHRGLTSQDVMDTSLMLALSEVLAAIAARLSALDQQLAELQVRYGDAKLMAYTRMQPALETTGAEVISRWRQPLDQLQTDLVTVGQNTRILQWGGPIGTRDHPLAANLALAFAANLGLRDPGRAWHTDRTVITQVANILTRITAATGKIGADIALMAAIGPGQISLRGGGSSAMAHKNNPVKAEALVSLASYAATQQVGLANAAIHEGFRSGQAWTLEWLVLPQLCMTTGVGLVLTKNLLECIDTLG